MYLKLPWIGNVSSKVENQINKASTSGFYALNTLVAYKTRALLPSAIKIAFLPLEKLRSSVIFLPM